MKGPVWQSLAELSRDPFVDRGLELREAGNGRSGIGGKHEPVPYPGQRIQNGDGLRAQWHRVLDAVLCSSCRDRPNRLGDVHLGPGHMRHLGAPLAGQKKQLHQRSHRVRQAVSSPPYRSQFVIRQHTVAAGLGRRRLDAGARRRVDQPPVDGPGTELAERRQGPVGLNPGAPVDNVVEHAVDFGPSDGREPPALPSPDHLLFENPPILLGRAGAGIGFGMPREERGDYLLDDVRMDHRSCKLCRLLFSRRIPQIRYCPEDLSSRLACCFDVDAGVLADRHLPRHTVGSVSAGPRHLPGRLLDEVEADHNAVRHLSSRRPGRQVFDRQNGERLGHASPLG